jgi:very-short-patch-repair endonuclease
MVRLSDIVQRSMFYGAKPRIFRKAKVLRDNMTPSEKKLYEKLRNNQMLGLRFKSQHPIDQFIVDFYCHSLKLVIEVDGEVHDLKRTKDNDDNRTFELEKFGLTVIRFNNKDVINNIDSVVQKIMSICRVLIKRDL